MTWLVGAIALNVRAWRSWRSPHGGTWIWNSTYSLVSRPDSRAAAWMGGQPVGSP